MNSRSWGALALFGALWLGGCGGGGGDDASGGGRSTGSGAGTLQLSLTDAPACYEQVNVTVERVRIHRSANASDGDGSWRELVLVPARRIDLTRLTNGRLEDLGRITLPAGRYSQLRLVLAGNTVADPLANSVVPVGGSEVPLKTPSAQQSGLKLNVDVVVPDDRVAHLVVDFDACRSVVEAGRSGKHLLKPVLSATVLFDAAGQKVRGCVARTLPLASTEVSLQVGGVPVKSTVPAADGCFVLYPVPAGRYDLVVASPGHVSAVMTGVPVVLDAPTVVATRSLRIAPPPSTDRAVTGVVDPADAVVRALQAVDGGAATVEVRRAPVDADDGDFVMHLPIGAPIATAYASAGSTTLGFAPDVAAAGRYKVQVAAATDVRTVNVDVASPVPPLVFDLN